MRKLSLSFQNGLFVRGAVAAVALVGLSSCAEMTHTSGAASMRIDIDVYQGPLSMEPELQWGALYGQVEDGLRRLDQIIYATACTEKFGVTLFDSGECAFKDVKPDQSKIGKPSSVWDEYRIQLDEYWVDTTGNVIATTDAEKQQQLEALTERDFVSYLCSTNTWLEKIKVDELRAMTADICALRNRLEITFDLVTNWDTAYRGAVREFARGSTDNLSMLYVDYEEISGNTNTITVAELRPLMVSTLGDVSAFAEEMRVQALYYASSHVGHAERKRRVRTAIVDFAGFAAEYSNTLKSRADALLKQASGIDRRELPLSVQLREANPTAYLNLYVWNAAYNDRVAGEPTSTRYFEDRVKVINRLYNDEAWTRVNTAYASGQGDVAMAFIKDDIGNWGLKRFDNDPSQLLQAYKEVGKAALGTALTIASGGKMGSFRRADKALDNLSRAQSALALAENVAYGGGSASVAPVENRTLKRLHSSTLARLTNLKAEYTLAAEKLGTDIEETKALLKTAEDALKRAEDEVKTEKDKRPKGTEGETVETLRIKSVAAANRTAQTDADTEASEAQIAANNVIIIEKNNQKQQRNEQLQTARTEDNQADIERLTEEIRVLDTEASDLLQENAGYRRIIDDRARTKTDLETDSGTFLANAGLLEAHDANVAALVKDKLTPAQKAEADLREKLKQLEARKETGLYQEALAKAAIIVNSHEQFVSELEALVVEDQTAPIPVVAPVGLPASPTQPSS